MRNLIYLLLLFAQPVWAADAYLCITDQSTGFKHDPETDTWSPANFRGGQKYLFKRYKLTKLDKTVVEDADSSGHIVKVNRSGFTGGSKS